MRRVIGRVLAGLLVVVALGVAVGAVVAWHEGYRLYAVRTGSMAPTYPTGSLVIDAPATDGTASVGDVITFRVSSGLVTHRVHAISAAGYSTKGDANPEPDAWTISPAHVVGHVIAGAPGLGYLLVFFQQPTGAVTVVTALLALSLLWGLFFPPDEPDETEADDTEADDTEPAGSGLPRAVDRPARPRHASAPVPVRRARDDRAPVATVGAPNAGARVGAMPS